MARPTRLDIEGGWYHVVNRGIERRAIFRAAGNYEHFLKLLAKAVARFAVRVHGYVLMGNHYHLQLGTPRANLSNAMQWLNAAYSIWYNRQYARVGPLFQGRFKAILHDGRTHGLVINRYLHLNPVRVKRLGGHEGRGEVKKEPAAELSALRVKALGEYRWSSYGYYAGTKKTPNWLSTESILEQLDYSHTKARGEYRKQLEQAAAMGRWEADARSLDSSLGNQVPIGASRNSTIYEIHTATSPKCPANRPALRAAYHRTYRPFHRDLLGLLHRFLPSP
jgi:putative transposase